MASRTFHHPPSASHSEPFTCGGLACGNLIPPSHLCSRVLCVSNTSSHTHFFWTLKKSRSRRRRAKAEIIPLPLKSRAGYQIEALDLLTTLFKCRLAFETFVLEYVWSVCLPNRVRPTTGHFVKTVSVSQHDMLTALIFMRYPFVLVTPGTSDNI